MKNMLTLAPWTELAKRPLLLVSLMLAAACSDLTVWKEEVKLSDGRVVQITQKHRCTGRCVTREAWLTVRLPETGNNEVTWHEGLQPMILNVYTGEAYIVATPSTSYAWRVYGRPEPEYLAFRWETDRWNRIPLDQLPPAIYDTNLLIDPGKLRGNTLTLVEKESDEFNGSRGYQLFQRRVDLRYPSGYAKAAKTEACTWDATNTVCTQNSLFSK